MPGLSSRDLEEAYAEVLQVIQTAHSECDISATIYSFLETSFEVDERHICHGRHVNHDRNLLSFRAIAEMSRQTNSLRMGHILYCFFLSAGAALMENDEADRIFIWTYAIHQARMRSDEKRSCLEFIVEYVPDIIDSLGRYGSLHAPYLERELARVANDFGTRDTFSRGRDYRHLSRRRLLSPSRSPNQRLGRRTRRQHALPGDLIRPHSALGDRHIVRQADRVIDAAEEMREEAEILRDLATRR